MRKIIPTILLLSVTSISFCQKVSSKLKFEQGQTLEVVVQLKTSISQQAGGQAIDFDASGTGTHSYKVTNATDDNTTLHHQPNRVTFFFDGMGQKMNFDSDKEKDLNGQYGKPVKELLDKKFDVVIDGAGQVLMVKPEKLDMSKTDDRFAIITNMLKDVLDIVQPPRNGKASFFKILPDKETGKGESWADTVLNESVKAITNYSISDINDSTIVVDLVGNSVTVSKAEMMGNEITTTMNNKTTGKIFLDRITGIIREKNLVTESNGTTESAFGNLPVTSKTTTTIKVNTLH